MRRLPLKKRLELLTLLLSMPYRADRVRTVGVLLLAICQTASLTLVALWLKLLADGVIRNDPTLVHWGAAGLIGSVTVASIANFLQYTMQETLRDKTLLSFDLELMDLSGGVHTIEHHERPEYATELSILRMNRTYLAFTGAALAQNTQNAVQLALVVGLLISIHPLLVLLPAFAVPTLWAARRNEDVRNRADVDSAEDQRRAKHLLDMSTGASAAKEIQLFGLADELLSMYTSVRRRVVAAMDRANRRTTLNTVAGAATFGFGYVIAVVFVVIQATNRRATPGDVLLTVNLAAQVLLTVRALADGAGVLQGCLRQVGRFVWLRDYRRDKARTASEDGAQTPRRLSLGIRLENVSFAYPGTDEDVLRDLDILLPAGKTVALVGENGAGKSTLVKLLLRLYDLQEGRVFVDDVELASLDPTRWRLATSAGFQDFVRFELMASEVVGVGDLPRIGDEKAVLAALGRAGAAELPRELPASLHSQLGRRFDDGVELSAGQWQKVALGRAMMRESPLLLVLDEPTANIDAPTEYALFQRYVGVARELAAVTGAITVLVTHRFSTVRAADLIIVLEKGRIAEFGGHDELLAAGGLYAELYELQARAYR